MDSSNPGHRSWSDLPIDILILIADRLIFKDHIVFGAVCKQFKLVASTTLHFQSLYLPWQLIKSNSGNKLSLFSPLECKMQWLTQPYTWPFCKDWCFGTYMGWLALASEVTFTHSLLFNPFTNQRVVLPYPPNIFKGPHPFFNPWKVVLSSYPSPYNRSTRNCVVVALCIPGGAYCRPGDKDWSALSSKQYYDWVDDIIFFNGLLYCLLDTRRVAVYEFGPNAILKYTVEIRDKVSSLNYMTRSSYFVESKTKLLIVVEYKIWEEMWKCSLAFKVFEFEQCAKLVEMRSLENEIILFDGCGTMISADVENYSKFGFRRNCIYYTYERHFRDGWHEFCLEDKKNRQIKSGGSPSLNSPFRWLMLHT